MHRVAGPVVVVVALSFVLAPTAAARAHDKLVGGLGELARGGHPWAKPTGPAVQPLPGVVRDGKVLVDVYVTGAVTSRADGLRRHGMRVEAVSRHEPQRMVEGWLPVSALEDVAALGGTQAVVPVYEANFNTGSATSEGDAAHHGPQARSLGPTGTGVPVGIMSDSIDQRGTGVAGSQVTGDLPADVEILDDPASGSDEGRAMAQIVYDEAPGIPKIIFARGGGGAAVRAANIDALVDAGAKVIADDVVYLTEPFFQDGIIAQAADRAKADGTAYIVSAGNRARQSWEGTFTPTGSGPVLNDFDPGAPMDTRQTIATVPAGQKLNIFLQWDDPVGAVTNDFALDFYNANTDASLASIDTNNVASGQPREMYTAIAAGTPLPLAMSIRRVAGTDNRRLKWIASGSFTGAAPPVEFAPAQAIDPDASSARGALTIAAVRHNDPGLNDPESFSARGPTVTRYLGTDGKRLATPDVRQKPDLAGADGVATTTDFDNTAGGQPDLNPFFGTSAAAPSVAGVAALVLAAKPSLSVDELYAILKDPRGNIDCTAAGQPDADCGWGFPLADAKVQMALDTTPPAVAPVTSPAAPDGSNGWFHSPVGLSWNVTDAESPVTTHNCDSQTVATDGVVAFTCTATSPGGTTNQPITIRRDSQPPVALAFTGIAPGARLRKLPPADRIECTATDATSGMAGCAVSGYSKKPGRHTLTATATDQSGLSSTSTLTYNFRPPAASHLTVRRNQSLASLLRSGLRCTVRTAERRTKLRAILKLGSTVLGRKTTRSKRAGKTSVKIPLTAAGRALLRGASHATVSVSVRASSPNTSRVRLRKKRALAP